MLSNTEQKLLDDLKLMLGNADVPTEVPDLVSEQKVVTAKPQLSREKEEELLNAFESLFKPNNERTIPNEHIEEPKIIEEPDPIDEIIASVEETRNGHYIDEIVNILKNNRKNDSKFDGEILDEPVDEKPQDENNGVRGTGFDTSIAGKSPDVNKYKNDADFIRRELNGN